MSIEHKDQRESKLSPRNSDGKKSKRRRHSRSRSGEAKHRSSDQIDERRDKKAKHHSRRRSRSGSEGGHRRNVDEKKSKHRKRSRSRSIEIKHKANLNDEIDGSREKKTKHRGRKRSRSVSAEGKDKYLDERKSKQRGSRSKSEKGVEVQNGDANSILEDNDSKFMMEEPNFAVSPMAKGQRRSSASPEAYEDAAKTTEDISS